MYRGGHPNWLARPQNRLSAVIGGLLPSRMVTLEVTGRRTGRRITLPLAVAGYQGERYLVSMLGNDANWVRNVRAAGGTAVLRHGRRREPVHLEETAASARPPVLRRYLDRAPGARPHIPVSRRAPLGEFEPIAARFPVFRITAEPGPKAIARRFVQVWGDASLDVIDELAAPGLSVYYPLLGQPVHGAGAFRRLLAAYRAAFPDAAIAVDEEIADGDKVAVRWDLARHPHRRSHRAGPCPGHRPPGHGHGHRDHHLPGSGREGR